MITFHQTKIASVSRLWWLPVTLSLAAGNLPAIGADSKDAKEKESELIRILQSDAPPAQKAVPCKQLAIYGTKDAVPALTPLLWDKELASWARIALEAIPDPAADAALRKAANAVHGNLLIGTINSIGVRRDTKGIGLLGKKLQDSDNEVASAAAIALGKIGGSRSGRILTQALPKSKEPVRGAIAEGEVLCAQRFLAEGKKSEALKLYDNIRNTDVPKEQAMEATRGAILARGTAGLPLLLEQLRSMDKMRLAIGLHTARELPGREITDGLTAELRRINAERQSFLLLALADRKDASVLPAILDAAKSGGAHLKLTAVQVLDRLGNSSSVPVLLDAAADQDQAVSQAAVTALARMPGNQVDSDLLGRMPNSTGKMRQVLIELAGLRRIEAAMPVIVKSATDPDSATRSTAINAIANLGTEKQVADLVGLLNRTQNARERDDLETALIALSGRVGAPGVPGLMSLAQSTDSALRTIGLHALASAGGPEALTAVKSALQDKDEAIQDEAVRTLATWPNNWPEDSSVAEPLLTLAKSGKNMSQQVLGLRGYLQYVKGDSRLKDDERVTKVKEVLPLIQRPEEKRFAIAVIDSIRTPAVLDLLSSFASETAITEDAYSAIVRITGRNADAMPREQRQKALTAVFENSKNQDTKKRAEDLLAKLQAGQ